ncbi:MULTISPECIES: sigma factor-like helix-turn-helix DNA-binding protein [Corynebacterium]|uniref:RNA polymerase subunit sigma-70 n=2 Tax=Corynebacterium TaxID=1716 RepID=A0A269PBE2_9CORY|nr:MULTISPECIES: sigma factor-like helix-turn-helix DNA-binding protein [Corynebacterium]PAJ68686.1 RNA polymerase subunit sigma-70 [Corynebacterium hadale]RMD18369.1 helix-turn-helix domain-containing protein [Corynebacterium gottingense]WKC59456.1 flagellar biosynthesis sigma factor [Corynebacterium hadale]
MKVTVRYEALNARNESTSKTLDIDSGELALMIETDRHERARQAQKPVEDIEPRQAQQILDELWRAEEAVNHRFHRGDRGKGRKECTCGAGCEERRGCRLPSTHPWSLDQMLEIDRDPATSALTPEDALIAAEEAHSHAADLLTMRAAIAQLSERHRLITDLMIQQGMSQADVARHLGVTRARVSQLFREVKTAVIEAVEESRLNSRTWLGSGVKGPAKGAGPQPKESR